MRGEAGRGGGRFLKRGVLGWVGGAFYVRTCPRKGRVKAEIERTGDGGGNLGKK